MTRYGLIWLEIAHVDYASLPEHNPGADQRPDRAAAGEPPPARDGYDQRTDQWTTTYGDGAGLIVYAVVHERQRVIILRLV